LLSSVVASVSLGPQLLLSDQLIVVEPHQPLLRPLPRREPFVTKLGFHLLFVGRGSFRVKLFDRHLQQRLDHHRRKSQLVGPPGIVSDPLDVHADPTLTIGLGAFDVAPYAIALCFGHYPIVSRVGEKIKRTFDYFAIPPPPAVPD
jgi:hypothetical protein